MAFDWTQYLILARALATGTEESELRSAISRAYYAAFKTAEHFCEKNGFPPIATGKPHQDVWDAFLAQGGRTFTSVYDYGDRLRRKRIKSDYRSHETITMPMTEASLRESYAILSYLGASPPPP